jgi:hypothetical protein
VAAPLSVLPSALGAYPDHPAALARLRGFRARLHACCTHRGRADGPGRCAAERPRARVVAAAAEPGAGPPARLGQHLRRAGPWSHRRRAAARAARRLSASRRPAGVRRGRDRLAALRRRVLPGAWPVLSPLPPLGRGSRLWAAGRFQWIAQVSFDHECWTAPVDAQRLHPLDDTDHTAASQIRALLGRLPADGPVPWFVCDAGYDSAQLTLDLADVGVVVLVRLRSDRCFYADPPPRPPGARGPAAPPRRQFQLRRPDHLADPDRQPHHQR